MFFVHPAVQNLIKQIFTWYVLPHLLSGCKPPCLLCYFLMYPHFFQPKHIKDKGCYFLIYPHFFQPKHIQDTGCYFLTYPHFFQPKHIQDTWCYFLIYPHFFQPKHIQDTWWKMHEQQENGGRSRKLRSRKWRSRKTEMSKYLQLLSSQYFCIIILWLLKSGITMLIHKKDDIEFVTEFPCLLGHPVVKEIRSGAVIVLHVQTFVQTIR